MVEECITPWGNTVHWYHLWGLIWLGKGREKANLSRSRGCKGIVKKQSCSSVIIISQFWGIVVGDGIPDCNAPIGFLEVLTFRRSIKRRYLPDFFFITKMGEFQGEQDSSIRFSFNCVSISSLEASNFSSVRGYSWCTLHRS